MTNEGLSGTAGGKLPQPEGLVPGRGQSISAVGGYYLDKVRIPRILLVTECLYAVGDDMRMAVETSFGVAICSVITSQMPDDQSLVSASRKEHIRASKCLVNVNPGLRGTALFKRRS